MVREELTAIKEQFGDNRRTEITGAALNMAHEDLVQPQDMVVTLSHAGYVKAVALSEYQAQRRGGRGKLAATTKDELAALRAQLDAAMQALGVAKANLASILSQQAA